MIAEAYNDDGSIKKGPPSSWISANMIHMTTPVVGTKHDSGKIKAGIIAEFQHALMAVAAVGTLGVNKYSRGNWQHVDSAVERYTDAMWRHLLQEGDDPESGLPHFHHFVWNALALLEMQMKQNTCGKSKDMV